MTASPTDHDRPASEVPLLNVANVLTVLRIVLVPVFLVIFFVAGAQDPWWRLGAFGTSVLGLAIMIFGDRMQFVVVALAAGSHLAAAAMLAVAPVDLPGFARDRSLSRPARPTSW